MNEIKSLTHFFLQPFSALEKGSQVNQKFIKIEEKLGL